MANEQAFVERTRSEVRTFLDAWEKLQGAAEEYNRLGAAANPDLDAVDYGDIDKAKFVSIFVTIGNLDALLSSGDGTNLYEAAS